MANATTKRHKKSEAPQKSAPRKQAPKAAASSTAKQATKSDQILALLRKPGGATLKALMAASGWQAHSVRGFISGQLVKKMGLRVKSLRRDGERVYAVKS